MAFSLAPTAVVASLYIAYFNRAVESAGLAYWRDQYRNELARHGDEADTNAQLSAWIYAAGQDEAALEEPLSDAEFVTSIYQNLLGRGRPAVDDIDREGFSFWLNHLEQGNVSRAEFAAAFISGISATTDPEGAAFFALALRTSLTWARSDASQGLDADAARALGEQVLQDALYPPEPEPEPEPEPQPEPEPEPQPGGPIPLKHGMTSALGTTGDDVFVGDRLPGGADFLDTLRSIDGLDGYDTLKINDTATAAGDDLMLESHLVVQNVEDVQVSTTGNLRGTNHDEWDTGAYIGLETLTLQARGSGRSAVIVNTGVDLSADVAGSEFDLLGVGLPGAGGITDLTVRATDEVSVTHRGQITLVDAPLDDAPPGLTDVALIDIWGTATVKAPVLDTLRLRELDDSASIAVETSGGQAFEVQLFEVGADTQPVTLSIALDNTLTGGNAVTLRSMGDGNHVALTLAGDNPLHILGGRRSCAGLERR